MVSGERLKMHPKLRIKMGRSARRKLGEAQMYMKKLAVALKTTKKFPTSMVAIWISRGTRLKNKIIIYTFTFVIWTHSPNISVTFDIKDTKLQNKNSMTTEIKTAVEPPPFSSASNVESSPLLFLSDFLELWDKRLLFELVFSATIISSIFFLNSAKFPTFGINFWL